MILYKAPIEDSLSEYFQGHLYLIVKSLFLSITLERQLSKKVTGNDKCKTGRSSII